MRNLMLALFFICTFLFNPLVFCETIPNWSPQMVMQVVGENNAKERTISWQTTGNVDTYLELINSKGSAKIFKPVKGMVHYNNLSNYTHTVYLKDLQENNTDYKFILHAKKNLVSPVYLLKASPETTALIFGDAQSYDYNVWKKTADKAQLLFPKASLFIGVGDQVDNGERYKEWAAWYNGAKDLVTSIPIAPVIGNHETYSSSRTPKDPTTYLSYFPLPLNGPATLKKHAYSFVQGSARFIVLDSQAGEERISHPNLLQEQSTWLDKELENAKEPWKIVMMHRSPLETNGALSAVGNAFVSIMEKHKVNLVFNGHTHIYERTVPIKGITYVTCGRSGTKTYPNSPNSKPNSKYSAYYYNPLKEPNFLSLAIKGNTATIRCFTQSGKEMDTFTLTK